MTDQTEKTEGLKPLERIKVYAMTSGTVSIDSQRVLHMIRQIEYGEGLQEAYDNLYRAYAKAVRTVYWITGANLVALAILIWGML